MPGRAWTDDEIISFEKGILLYRKNFPTIKQNLIPSRTTKEVVNFYYLWKKSARCHKFFTKNSKKEFIKRMFG
ncbi:Mesoderm induction early response protein 3 [Tyrophagus putrescentiae]|nr:Mesoderm induction early response protein 3 [Tyrophagus putrescentiae]